MTKILDAFAVLALLRHERGSAQERGYRTNWYTRCTALKPVSCSAKCPADEIRLEKRQPDLS